ncbi:MAG: nucleotide exchange factor GrpE [Muribaculaceae bacterium]|nr:nucleotide exchange factor GrpE [Muribaculaceae bacterium]
MFRRNKKKNMTDNKENQEFKSNVDCAIDDNLEQAQDQLDQQQTEAELNEEENEVAKLQAELDAANEALAKEKKEYLFLMAEFDNFRKRTIKEKSDLIRNGAAKALEALLPIVDDFERGLEANKTAENAEAIKQGMELIYNKLIKYLEQQGVKPIPSTGEDFNPDLHEAIAMVPAADESQKGKIIDTPTKGYTLNGETVLRHAKVVVAQ